ncbi:MAG TPA: type IV pilus modification protein PilV [Gallionella sp.]|nr:type IV pilus modification protein PilV [Gallionella sp.]
MGTSTKSSHEQLGFSMVEVLVTLIILLVGLLGLAGLSIQAQRSQMESYQRVQALVLLDDMVERINANRANVASYVTTNIGDPADGQPAANVCPTLLTIAARDLCEWSNALKGVSEQKSGVGSVGTLAGGRGCITYDAASRIAVISVAWQGLGETVAPPASLNCGAGLYGSETRRRVVSLPVRIGCLTC